VLRHDTLQIISLSATLSHKLVAVREEPLVPFGWLPQCGMHVAHPVVVRVARIVRLMGEP